MKIALDAKTVARLLDGDPPHLRERMDAALEAGHSLCMSSLVLHEIAYSAMASDQAARRLAQLDTFIARVEVAAWTSEDALTAARIRADHEKEHGHRAGLDGPELLCAAQALNNDWAVISERPLPFDIKISGLGLRTLDWSTSTGD
jgi:predicted nucleic acid-binding protein